MALFVYKARKDDGTLVTGELDGESPVAIKEALADQGLLPVEVQAKGFERSISSLLQRSLNPKDLVSVTRQFQIMFSVGTPMDKILQTLERQCRHKGLKEVLGKIQKDVEAGVRLSAAFAKHPHFFNKLYIAMLEVGESAGVLEKTLKEMTTILEKETRIQSKVKSATLYPKLALSAVAGVAIFMLTVVIPVFKDTYSQFGAELPLPTLVLMGMSQFLISYWYLAGLAFGGLFYGWRIFLKTKRGLVFAARLRFALPVFGHLHRLVADARFGHLVSSLYRAGLPLTSTLDVVANTIDNHLYSEDVRKLRDEVSQGSALATAMERCRYFSPLMIETTAVGEQTGNLDKMLEATAGYYDEEADDILKNLSTLIEPLLLLVIFGFVALLALAFFLPMWNLSTVVL